MPLTSKVLIKIAIAILVGGSFTGTLSFVQRGLTLGFDNPATVVSLPPIMVGGIAAALIVYFFLRSRYLVRFSERAKILDTFDAAPQGITLWDSDDQFVWCNESYKTLRPTAAQYLTQGIKYGDYVRQARTQLTNLFGDALEKSVADRTEKLRDTENEWEDETVTGRTLLVNKKVLPDGSVIAFYTDVTEHRRRQELLHFLANQEWHSKSENFFHQLVQKLAELADVEYVFVDRMIDDSTVETLALYAKGEIAENIKYDLEGTPCENVAGNEACSYRMDIQKLFPKDLLLVDMGAVGYSGVPLWGPDGKPLGLIAVISTKPLDNSDFVESLLETCAVRVSSELLRLEWEQSLQENEERFRHYAEAAADRFWETDENHRFIYMSKVGEESGLVSIDEAIGKRREEMITNTHSDEDINRLYAYMDAHEPFRDLKYSVYQAQNNKKIHVLNSGTPIFDLYGTFKGYRGVISDITEQVNSESQLRQSQKMEAVGQLSSGIAHDFNNLLMAALGNVEFLEEDVADNPEAKGRATIAKKAILRGAELTNRLLAFSRKQDLEPEPTDVAELVNGLRTMFQRTIPESIDLIWTVPKNLWPVEIDRSQLESALLNLVLNSRDAMLAGGTLAISCNNENVPAVQQINNPNLKAGGYVAITVEDTGMGIKKSHLNQIIDPFFTTKGVGEGSGLGLSMVYGFVTQSGGHVDIESEVGVGTKITLCLPRHEATAEADDFDIPIQDETPLGNGETILVIEDEPDVREITIQQLKNLGYDVVDGGDGKNILDTCNDENCYFDLVLSDVILPNNTSGTELIELINECNSSVKTLLMTGYAPDEVIRSEDGEHLYPVIGKPFSKDDLARKVSSVLNDGAEIPN